MEECWFSRSNAEATSLGNVDARIKRCEVGFQKMDVQEYLISIGAMLEVIEMFISEKL